MRYIIDGYNVTKQDPATCDITLEEQREALVSRLATRGRDLLGVGPITVVFDGQWGIGPDTRRGPVEVKFSRGEKADELIARLTEGSGDVVVVTSDNALKDRVRSAGASVRGCDQCFAGRTPARKKRRQPAGDAGLPRGANEITRELKDLWLGDEE